MRRRDPPVAELSREWFARPTAQVARDLVGCTLMVDAGSPDAVVARIVETEAYLGLADPASHAFRGPTPRCAVMFGPPAHLYVYFTYGMHHCANVVTDIDGVAGAVLLRAASVEEGFTTVVSRRAGVAAAAMLRGPGNLCRGLGITRADDGIDLLDPRSRLHIAPGAGRPPIAVSTRVGVRLAADRLLRFTWEGDPAVSSPLPRAPAVDAPSRDKRKGPD
ncbi:MAG TPA: DNA-3-methyladenine glycosylase [Candidatus Dormibacteraeota bacterium]